MANYPNGIIHVGRGRDFWTDIYGNDFQPEVIAKNAMEFSQSDLGRKIEFMDSDVLNYYQTENAAYRDYLKWMATNEWNLEQWYRENDYNSPLSQKERYLQAGINPLWAMSDGNSGQAQQLTSQQPSSSTLIPATMESERLAQDYSQFVQSNALQSTATLGDLSIKERALRNEIRKTDSDLTKVRAETELLKSQLESNDWQNKINATTFDIQVNLKIEELNKVREDIKMLQKQEQLTEDERSLLRAQIDYEKILISYTEAMAKKVESETFDKLENLRQRWFALQTARQQAQAASVSATAAMQQAQTADSALNHQIEKDAAELKHKSNEQILQILEMNRSWIDKAIGNPGNIGEELFGGNGVRLKRVYSLIKAGYTEVCGRFYTNPTKANAEAMDKIQKLIDDFQRTPVNLQFFTPNFSVDSVNNPSSDW